MPGQAVLFDNNTGAKITLRFTGSVPLESLRQLVLSESAQGLRDGQH